MGLRLTVEMSQNKQDFERRFAEKEEEVDNTRRNGQRALESMQTTMDSESKARAEAIRQKKKLEGDFNDLEIQLGHANRQANEATKQSKMLQGAVKANLAKYDEAERRNEDIGEQMAVVERRSNLLNTQNTALINQKRKLETELQQAQGEVEESISECRNAEEKAKKSITDAAMMSEELKKEQDQSQHLERM